MTDRRNWRRFPPVMAVDDAYLHPFWCMVLMLIGGMMVCANDSRLEWSTPWKGGYGILAGLGILILALPYAWFIGRRTRPSGALFQFMFFAPIVYGLCVGTVVWTR